MCPQASGAGAKYAYLDHDTDIVDEAPPIQNQWYTVFDAEDVRLIWCKVYQKNDEMDLKAVEIKWTIDGTEYLIAGSQDCDSYKWVHRDNFGSTGGTRGLDWWDTSFNAAYFVDKRGQDFKVEIRMTSVPGTNQELKCWCVRETLEQT